MDICNNSDVEIDLLQQFCCLGPVCRLTHTFHKDGFLKNKNFLKNQPTIAELFNKSFKFQEALIENLDELFNCCRYASKNSLDNDFLTRLEDHLWKLRLLFHKLSCAHLPNNTIHFYASSLGDQCTNPDFHIIHCHLDVRWLFIKIIESLAVIKKQQEVETQFSSPQNVLCVEEEIMMLMTELLWFSIVRYEKVDKTQLITNSSFSCVCVKEMWLLLLHYPYKFQDFWTFFNQTIRIILDNKNPPSQVTRCSTKMSPPEYLPCSNRCEFSMWVLTDLARLQEYDETGNYCAKTLDVAENFDLLGVVLKEYLNSGETPSEEKMRAVLPMLCKIHSVWKHAKSEPVIALLEYFHKKINSAFYVPGSKLNSMVVVSKSGAHLLEQVKSRLTEKSGDKYENSYFMFLRLLGSHLRGQIKAGVSVSRLCGRVFIKFPLSRVERLQELQDIGVFHVCSLYLTLAFGSDSPSTVVKLIDLLAAIPRSDIKECKHEMIWKGYGAALLALQEMNVGLDMGSSINSVLEHFQWCHDRHLMAPVSHLVETVKELFTKDVVSSKGLENIIGPWMKSYLKSASKSEATRLVYAFLPLLKTLERYRNNHTSETLALLCKVEEFLPGLLKDQLNLTISEVAALFTLISSSQRCQLFDIWSDCPDCLVAAKYLTTILQMGGDLVFMYLPQAPAVAIQVWIRCVFLTGDSEDSRHVMSVIKHLPQLTQHEVHWESGDPFLSFINYFGTEYSHSEALSEKSMIRDEFLSFFVKFDKWIEIQFKQIDSLRGETVDRIYKYSAFMFAYCPNLIYTRSNPRSLLKSIVDTLLLFPQIYKPDHKPHRNLIKAITDYLPLFFNGLLSLDPGADPYIGRLVRDVVTQYVPRLNDVPIINHPIVSLLCNNLSSSRIVAVLGHFLQVRGRCIHPQAINVLKLLQQASNNEETSIIIFNATIDSLIELMIVLDDLHPVKNKTLDYLASAITCHSNRTRMIAALESACRKNMAFNSGPWFKAVSRVAPLIKKELDSILEVAEEEIFKVEKRRGVERDLVLRNLLKNLRNIAESMKK